MPNYDLEAIADACGGKIRSGKGFICRCPVHDDKEPSLSLSMDCDKLLAHCFAGCAFEDIAARLRDIGFDGNVASNQKYYSDKETSDKTAYAQKIWSESTPAKGTLVEIYLHERGYTGEIPDDIRFHPSLKHAPSEQNLPAMIAGVTLFPNNNITAIHRTYLKPDGTDKASVTPNKMMLGSVSGGAVMFGARTGNNLIVTEGIETALSLFLSTGFPTWAALSASGMAKIILPSIHDVYNLLIAADHDETGMNAATKLGDREYLSGRNVIIIAPETYGSDFNDLLRS